MCVVFFTLLCAFVQITDGSCNGQFIFLVILERLLQFSVASCANFIALVDFPNALIILSAVRHSYKRQTKHACMARQREE